MTAEAEVLAEEVIDAVEPLLRTLASAEEGLVPRVPPSQLRARGHGDNVDRSRR